MVRCGMADIRGLKVKVSYIALYYLFYFKSLLYAHGIWWRRAESSPLSHAFPPVPGIWPRLIDKYRRCRVPVGAVVSEPVALRVEDQRTRRYYDYNSCKQPFDLQFVSVPTPLIEQPPSSQEFG